MRLRLLALTLAVITPCIAAAQFAGAGVDPLTISVAPQYPAPFSQAALTFSSNSLDLTNATLTVSVAGKQIYSGNVQTIPVQLGKAGAPIVATAVVTSNGVKTSQIVTIVPEDVALIAEPVSSVPPLYPGKPQVPESGVVRVVAMANLKTAGGKALDPLAVSYAWTVDGQRMPDASGIGKQSVLVATPLQYRSRDVSVVVTNADGSLVGGDTLTVMSEDPSVRIYQNDPLLGIEFEHAISSSYTISGAESTLYAAPFSFATDNGAPSLAWFLDGSAAQTGSTITLRPTGSGGGTANLTLTATGAGTSASVANANLSLTFGPAASSNSSGL